MIDEDRLVSCLLELLFDLALQLGRYRERDMVKSRLRLGLERLVHVGLSKPQERERTAVRQTIKCVAITDWSFREIRKLSNLSPSREQRHPDDVFVEVTRSLMVLHHACVMVQPLRQFRQLCFWICAHFEASNIVSNQIRRTAS